MGKETDFTPTKEYQKIRDSAHALSKRMPPNHPCQAGNGECCRIRNVAITEGDAKVLVQATKNGEITHSTLKKALANAADSVKENPYCIFFDRVKRTCEIYQFRPIECISYGMGAEAEFEETYNEAIQVLGETGVDTGIPILECEHIRLCKTCLLIQAHRGAFIPLKDIDDSKTVTNYRRESDTFSLDRVIVEDFPILFPELTK